MDPVSITASIAGIVGVCLQVVVSLDKLRIKLRNAHVTITALSSQCCAIKVGLSEIQTLLLGNHSIGNRPDIVPTLDSTLTGCLVVLTCFDETLNKLSAAGAQTGARHNLLSRWRNKTRIAWNEEK